MEVLELQFTILLNGDDLIETLKLLLPLTSVYSNRHPSARCGYARMYQGNQTGGAALTVDNDCHSNFANFKRIKCFSLNDVVRDIDDVSVLLPCRLQLSVYFHTAPLIWYFKSKTLAEL